MAIEGYTSTNVYKTHTDFVFFWLFLFLFLFWKKKQSKEKTTKQKQTNNMKVWKKYVYAWRHDRKMQMHESMIPKADKKSCKESPTLDRKN